MVLSKNEAWLLAFGYTFDKEDIRIPVKEYKVLKENKIVNMYLISDMEAAKDLYKRYKKSYRRRLDVWSDEFIDNTLIVQMINNSKK